MFSSYYTPALFADLLVGQISTDRPDRILDLATGKGALLTAAALKWPQADLIAIDCDSDALRFVRTTHPHATIFPLDVVVPELPGIIETLTNSIDVAICNPPYVRIDATQERISVLADIGLDTSEAAKIFSSSTLFLAHLLRALRPGGELGVILPTSLMANKTYYPLRKFLIQHHHVRAVIEIPPSTFHNTEASTHILILQKGTKSATLTPLYRVDNRGSIIGKIVVRTHDLLNRMDYAYHSSTKPAGITLRDLRVKVTRGRLSSKALAARGAPFLHTSHLAQSPQKLYLPVAENIGQINARTGDIAIGRVGTRVVGRRALIVSGSAPVSDCIFLLHSCNADQARIWEALTANGVDDWFSGVRRGVCAKFITKDDILGFPIDN